MAAGARGASCGEQHGDQSVRFPAPPRRVVKGCGKGAQTEGGERDPLHDTQRAGVQEPRVLQPVGVPEKAGTSQYGQAIEAPESQQLGGKRHGVILREDFLVFDYHSVTNTLSDGYLCAVFHAGMVQWC